MNFHEGFTYLKDGKWLKSTTFPTCLSNGIKTTWYLYLKNDTIYMNSKDSIKIRDIFFPDCIHLKNIQELDLAWLDVLLKGGMRFSLHEPEKILFVIPYYKFKQLKKCELNEYIDHYRFVFEAHGRTLLYFGDEHDNDIDSFSKLVKLIKYVKQCSNVYFPVFHDYSTNALLANMVADCFCVDKVYGSCYLQDVSNEHQVS